MWWTLQRFLRKLMNLHSSSVNQSLPLSVSTFPSSITLSGRPAAPSVAVRITSETAKAASSESRLAPLV